MLNLHHLSIFHAVAETKSISAGAQRLMISQPAVSKQLRQMERDLKTRLFDRHARGVDLTPTGLMLADYAGRIFGLLHEAGQALGDFSSMKRGSLSVGAGPTVGVYLLPSAIVRFRREHPQVLLRTETESAPLLRQRLLDGTLELAVSEAAIEDPACDSKILFHDLLVPIAAKDNPLTGKASVSAVEFCRQPFVARQLDSGSRSLVERTLAGRGLEIDPVLTVGSTEAIKQAVIAGVGVAMVSRLAISTEIAAGMLVEMKVPGLKIRYPVFQVSRKGRSISKLATSFLAFLVQGIEATGKASA